MTRKEALENIQEAVSVYLESLQVHNEPIPRSYRSTCLLG